MRNNDTQHIVRLSSVEHHPAPTMLATARKINTHSNNAHEVVAYRLPQSGLFGKFVALLLVPLIFVYPLAPLYAADDAAAATTTTETPPVENSDATPPPATESLAADLSSAVAGVAAGVASLFSDSSSTTEEATTSDATTTQETTTSDASTTPSEATTTTATTTDDGAGTTTPIFGGSEGGEYASSSENASSSEEVASTTEEVSAPQKSAQEIAREMLAAQEDSIRASIRKEVESEFTKGCVTLEGAGYYCLKDAQSGGSGMTPSALVTSVDSALGSSGPYKQIFITRSGMQEELTHFEWDNSFPTMDVSGKSVVWQGNVSGRWQIFFSSIPLASDAATSSAPQTIQVTHSNESNFNPKVDGNDVVWQGWVDGNWEIFLAQRVLSPDASTTPSELNVALGIDNNWSVTRITTNSVHDMFPAVAGGLVTWQSFQDNAWNVYVYNMKTGVTQKVSSGGAKSEKPRFAITWDERAENGDARMVGYDIATGKTIDITEEARTVNDEKPYVPPSPITQQDQAALPTSGAGTSTTAKSDGNDNGTSTPNGLDI